MNSSSTIICWIHYGISADASDFFELLGPILIFGVYIIASIVKAVAQKGKSDDSDKDNESELKKVVRRRYLEIYQRQTGKPETKPPQAQNPPPFVQAKPAQKVDLRETQTRMEWQRRQEEIRQRNAGIQQRQRMAAQKRRQRELKRVTAPVERPLAESVVQTVVKSPKKHTPKAIKTSGQKISPQTGNILADMISDPKNLRAAFVLKEILDKPVAMREEF
jgi:hypothetical protein